MDELQKVKKFLRQWESEFFQKHKRKPSKVVSDVLGVRLGHGYRIGVLQDPCTKKTTGGRMKVTGMVRVRL